MDQSLPALMASAFGIGLAMSGHCVGMCGPLATVVSLTGGGRPAAKLLSYSAGRITTYAVLGALAGGSGAILTDALRGSWLAPAVAASSLVVILVSALALLGVIPESLVQIAFPSRLLAGLLSGGDKGRPGLPRTVLVGAAFGFLPCGATFAMLGVALSAGSAPHGGAVMLAFGLGTLPAMTGVPYLAQLARRFGPRRGNRLAGVVLLVLALFGSFSLYRMVNRHLSPPATTAAEGQHPCCE